LTKKWKNTLYKTIAPHQITFGINEPLQVFIPINRE